MGGTLRARMLELAQEAVMDKMSQVYRTAFYPSDEQKKKPAEIEKAQVLYKEYSDTLQLLETLSRQATIF